MSDDYEISDEHGHLLAWLTRNERGKIAVNTGDYDVPELSPQQARDVLAAALVRLAEQIEGPWRGERGPEPKTLGEGTTTVKLIEEGDQ